MGKDLCKTHDIWSHTWSRVVGSGFWVPQEAPFKGFMSLCVWREQGQLGPVWSPGWARSVGKMTRRPAGLGRPRLGCAVG